MKALDALVAITAPFAAAMFFGLWQHDVDAGLWMFVVFAFWFYPELLTRP